MRELVNATSKTPQNSISWNKFWLFHQICPSKYCKIFEKMANFQSRPPIFYHQFSEGETTNFPQSAAALKILRYIYRVSRNKKAFFKSLVHKRNKFRVCRMARNSPRIVFLRYHAMFNEREKARPSRARLFFEYPLVAKVNVQSPATF